MGEQYSLSGTSLVVRRLRLCIPNAGELGSIPGQRTRSYMPQLKKKKKRSCMAQLRPSAAKTKQPKKPHSAGSLREGLAQRRWAASTVSCPWVPSPHPWRAVGWSCPLVPRTFAFLLGAPPLCPRSPAPHSPAPSAPPGRAVSPETGKFWAELAPKFPC